MGNRGIEGHSRESLTEQWKHTKLLWLGIGAFVLLGAVLAILSVILPALQRPLNEVPLATCAFDDGFQFSLLRAELADEMRFTAAPAYRFIPTPISINSGQNYNSKSLSVETKLTNKKLAEAVLTSQPKKPGLMILFRATEVGGESFANDEYMAGVEGYSITRSNGIYAKSETAGRPGVTIEEMALHFQVEDGAGSWLSLDGPIVVDKEDGRGFAFRMTFPRRNPDLKMRALRKGCVPVEFQVRNPGYNPPFPSLSPEALPATREEGEFKVTLRDLNWATRGTREGFVTNFLHGDSKERRMLYTGQVEVYDETGNCLLYHHAAGGYEPLPSEDICRLIYRVRRNPSQYPWSESDVLMIAEGTHESDGSSVARITEAGTRLGYSSIDFTKPSSGAISGYSIGAVEWRFQLKGETDAAGWSHLDGNYDQEAVAVFVSAEHSSGVCRSSGRSWGRSSLRSRLSFDAKHQWEGKITSGQKFRIGLVKKMPPVDMEFIVKIPPKEK